MLRYLFIFTLVIKVSLSAVTMIDPIWKTTLNSVVYHMTVDKKGYTIAATAQKVYYINPDGAIVWEYFDPEDLYTISGITLNKDETTVYVSKASGRVVALDKQLGQEKWRYIKKWRKYASKPTLTNSHLLLTTMDHLKAIDYNGKELWEVAGAFTNPTVDKYSNIYLSFSTGCNVYNNKGEQKWFFPTEYSPTQQEIVIDKTNTIYFTGYKTLYAIDMDGNELWHYDTPKNLISPAIDKDGNIYLLTEEGLVISLDKNANLRWQKQLDCPEYARQKIVIGEKGYLYVNMDNYFYILSPDGEVISYDLHLSDVFAPVRLTNDGYALISIGKLVAKYKVPSNGYQPEASWAVLGHDNYNSSNVAYNSMIKPTKEEVAKLYLATFNRAPDAAGLEYWVNSGLTISQIAQSFFEQKETQSLYPSSTTNREFVKAVYQNLFNRDPDTAGWDYWERELNLGNISKNRFIEAVINGARDTDAVLLVNKTDVALFFASQNKNDLDEARRVLEVVSSDIASVDLAKKQIVEGF